MGLAVTGGSYSVAMPEAVHEAARRHLLRVDGQEDICFGLWRPSRGTHRTAALIQALIFPEGGDRRLHGNVSFEPQFFERTLASAAREGAGLVMLHSHPRGRGWQDMSRPDIAAEQGNAGAVFGATDKPFVGMTISGDEAWSARFWPRVAPRTYQAQWCRAVRVVGEKLTPTFHPRLAPAPKSTASQVRTVSAWGEPCQADVARLRVGVIGAGSTGGFAAEALARTGVQNIVVIDFDEIKVHNLDRLVYATSKDIGRAKADVLVERLRLGATARDFDATPIVKALYEEPAYRAALDCDVLLSCVDRPWGRHVLNHIAYAHLIPVVDAGILVRTNRSSRLVSADWTAQTVAPGRPCLQCLGQYDAGMVQLEREGMLDDPSYIEGLADDHPLKARQNVVAFSMACASLQALQFLNMIVAPLGVAYSGAQRYHFVDATMEPNTRASCHENCLLPSQVALGDDSPFRVIR